MFYPKWKTAQVGLIKKADPNENYRKLMDAATQNNVNLTIVKQLSHFSYRFLQLLRLDWILY